VTIPQSHLRQHRRVAMHYVTDYAVLAMACLEVHVPACRGWLFPKDAAMSAHGARQLIIEDDTASYRSRVTLEFA
jgi:hypothetical protein